MSSPPRADARPRLALTVGDPAGIGPEIALAALAENAVLRSARLLVLGPGALRPTAVPRVTREEAGASRTALSWLDTGGDPATWELGRASAAAGRAALAALQAGHELALAGEVDALVTGPVSKLGMALAGERVEGQSELLGRWCGVERFEMLAVAGRLRVMLLTRHLPLRAALERITSERVLGHLLLLDEGLRELGFARPRLALAGLNPHAGEGGLLGEEDEALLAPAVRAARAGGLQIDGPISPDVVFLKASRGEHEGVLALYHDQAFIPVKLLSEGRGLTVLCGLPYLRVSPVHGTAFDIAGRGIASPGNLIAALLQAADWARARLGRRGGDPRKQESATGP